MLRNASSHLVPVEESMNCWNKFHPDEIVVEKEEWIEMLKDDIFSSLDDRLEECINNGCIDVSKFKRGDYIHTVPIEHRYRNIGTFIYDGEKIIPLDTDYIDYGTTPLSFPVIEEFAINSWRDLNSHNYEVGADLSKYKESAFVTEVNDGYIKGEFVANGVKYDLIVITDISYDDEPTTIYLSYFDKLRYFQCNNPDYEQHYQKETTLFALYDELI